MSSPLGSAAEGGAGGGRTSFPPPFTFCSSTCDQGSRRGPGCLPENPVQFGTVRWSLLGQCGACSSQSRGLRRAWAPSCLEAPKSGCRQNCARSWLLCPRLPSSRMSPRCACSGGPRMVPSPTCACCLSDCGGQRRPRPTRFRPCLLQPRQPGVQRPAPFRPGCVSAVVNEEVEGRTDLHGTQRVQVRESFLKAGSAPRSCKPNSGQWVPSCWGSAPKELAPASHT